MLIPLPTGLAGALDAADAFWPDIYYELHEFCDRFDLPQRHMGFGLTMSDQDYYNLIRETLGITNPIEGVWGAGGTGVWGLQLKVTY